MLHSTRTRRGTILPLLATCCFSLFAFIALAVDLGMLMIARTECQNAADAAALAGARTLDNDVPNGTPPASYDNKRPLAITNATSNVQQNYLLSTNFTFGDPAIDRVEIGAYDYDAVATIFRPKFHPIGVSDPSAKLTGSSGAILPWTAARVTVKGDQPTYFARIFGISSMPMLARATAVHRPRDISMVLDYSGSMKFGCTAAYPPGNGDSNGAIIGLLNPDPRIPQFGHYQRYDGLQTTNPNGSGQHPLRSTAGYRMASGEICSPNNLTYASSGGPPMVDDYKTSTLAPGSPVNPANLIPAFNTTVLPRPDTYNTQAVGFSGTTVGPVGDRWPRKGGKRYDTNVSWIPSNSDGAAGSVAELLFGNNWVSAPYPAATAFPTGTGIRTNFRRWPHYLASDNNISDSTRHRSDDWRSFLDVAWETYGYDLDIDLYNDSTSPTAAAQRTTELFQGYTMGPGHWGKTFFVWPPDPRFDPAANLTAPDNARPSFDTAGRPMCDWRRRFFLRGDGVTKFDPQTDNVAGTTGHQSINQALLNSAAGHVLTPTTANYTINYAAILRWLKAGPQTLPPNLRAGRILFYTQIPDNCASPGNDDERFWREYIDFVLGTEKNRGWYDPAYCMAGVENSAWGTLGIRTTQRYTSNTPAGSAPNPHPYMDYRDTPNMPRCHFWFGPHSMLMFISTRGQFSGSRQWNWNPGTVREAQSWQLKAAIQSSLEDIRKNHPNDWVGMAFFAHSASGNFHTPRVKMGQDFPRLKASLFFPKNIPGGADNGAFLTDVVNNAVREVRPYDTSFNSPLVGNLPNANGGTDPNNGLAQAFNMCSASTSGAPGADGRRGATKIIIFETDGVPNSSQNWDYVSAGINSRYNWIDGGAFITNGDPGIMNEAYLIAQQFVKPTTDGNPGYSLPNSPARIYPFGFGDLFSSTSPFRGTAETFLQTVAYHGNTNASSGTALPVGQIITGDYNTRISNLRDGLERVLQNGVQVTLIE